MSAEGRTAVVTGASSGIGAACVGALRAAGFAVVAGARRERRLREVTEPVGAAARPLDVTDPASIAAFVAGLDRVDVLVNNAGIALGLDPVEDSRDDDWRRVWETNVLGAARMVRALLPRLEASGDGHLVQLGSIAGFETYDGGGVYTSSKHALRAMTRTLRLELLGRPVRITEIAPGLVETEYARVRFRGDADRAAEVYRGMRPLCAEDVAECVVWAVTRPSHVNVDEIVVRPRDQATAARVHRRDPAPGTEADGPSAGPR